MTFKKKKKKICLGAVGKYIEASQKVCRDFMVWLKIVQNIQYM